MPLSSLSLSLVCCSWLSAGEDRTRVVASSRIPTGRQLVHAVAIVKQALLF